MEKKKRIVMISIVLLAAFSAALCRIIGLNGFLPKPMGILRCILQCALILTWAISVKRRILSRHVKALLTSIAGLLLFWLLIRSVRHLAFDGTEMYYQFFWYLFYIPMEFVPLLGVFAALYIGKPENYSLPKSVMLLLIPTSLITAMILTNQIHEFAFLNPELASDYTRGPGYFVAVSWMALLILFFLIVLLRRSRIPGKRKRLILPLLPIAVGVVYSVAYAICFDAIKPYIGDMTAVIVYLTTLTFEACIYTGLIQSNTEYDELFMVTNIAAQIIDEKNQLYLSSGSARAVPAEQFPQGENSSVMFPNHIRLSKKAIRGGSVLWSEDMTDLTEVISQLEDFQSELKSKHKVLQKEYQTRRRAESLKERNRLYNIMQSQTKDRVLRLKQLSSNLLTAEDEAEIREIFAEMALLSAYLKRRNSCRQRGA